MPECAVGSGPSAKTVKPTERFRRLPTRLWYRLERLCCREFQYVYLDDLAPLSMPAQPKAKIA